MKQHLVRFDWAIKKLLRSKANFGILEGFLSELLGLDLKIINIIEGESNREDKDDKSNKVDILVELENKEIVIVEVQVNTEHDYFHRMLFGTSKIITEHMRAGQTYSNVKKVYSVNVLYFNLGHGDDYIYHGTTYYIGVHSHNQLGLDEKQKALYQKDYVHQIYPEYYLINVNQFNDVAKNTLDEWIYFLKNEEIKEGFRAKGLLEAKEKLDSFKLPEQERRDYDRFVENLRYQESMAESTYDSGKIEGEKNKTIEIVKKMKSMNLSEDVIQKATGLSVGEIENI
jgi:predicted transposase/invertase (TIGR01784 family)